MRTVVAKSLLAIAAAARPAVAAPLADTVAPQCTKTSVLILGAGTAGIAAAGALSNNSIDDFVILEYNDVIGGRAAHTTFGKQANGKPYVIELGANWVQGTVTKHSRENPIWTLAKQSKLITTYSNYSSILTYNETGFTDYSSLFDDYEDAYALTEQSAGYILSENLLDRSARAGFTLSGWTPRNDPAKQAVDFWEWDFEYAEPPERTSLVAGIVNYNTTFYQFSEDNNFVHDPRGFNIFIRDVAYSYLKPKDPRLHLNTVIKNITWTNQTSITVHSTNGTCFTAPYAILTFSLGVLQAAVAGIGPLAHGFTPALPSWKQQALATFDMATYTKIFLQFNETFWPQDTQFYLYADPATRGWYPVWQNLDTRGFFVGSHILFVTVVGAMSQHVEGQSNEKTQAEVMVVLRSMFPEKSIPEPTAFLYPRWGTTEWAFGSYSNWPTGTTLQEHQNLRSSIWDGRLVYAGEATSAEYFGFLHGAWYEGQKAGTGIAGCLKSKNAHCKDLTEDTHYETLSGTTPPSLYNKMNGWDVTSFQTAADV